MRKFWEEFGGGVIYILILLGFIGFLFFAGYLNQQMSQNDEPQCQNYVVTHERQLIGFVKYVPIYRNVEIKTCLED